MKKESIKMLLITILLAATNYAHTQVTIGCAEKPVAGALLQLTEGTTTTKGLMLPRVKLTDLGKLKPMYSYIGTDTPSSTDLTNHTGLIVYNLPDHPVCPTIKGGLYLWEGNEWKPLKEEPDASSFRDNGDGTGILTDFEGNSYTCKKFGSRWWITQNLYSLKDATGKLIGCTDNGLRVSTGHYNSGGASPNIVESIPGGGNITYTENGVAMNHTYKQMAEKFGLLYSWEQAVTACPKGWHLSSKADWEDLVNVLGAGDPNVAGKKIRANGYTYISTDSQTWSWRGYAPGNTNNSGFNALPGGRIEGTASIGFGGRAFFWTSSLVYARHLGPHFDELYDGNFASIGIYFSVRCVKD